MTLLVLALWAIASAILFGHLLWLGWLALAGDEEPQEASEEQVIGWIEARGFVRMRTQDRGGPRWLR